MPTIPSWEAARSGQPGDLDATNHANQVDQFLGAHGITPVYLGSVLARPLVGAGMQWNKFDNATDIDQPFVMPSGKTATGRVTLPILPAGNGADLLVSLYPDNGSGAPNTTQLLASTHLPASWINELAAPQGLTNAGPLASPNFNVLGGVGGIGATPWAGPTGDASGVAQNASVTTSGNFMITAGGNTTAPVAAVNVIPFLGGTSIGNGILQPPIPAASYYGHLVATANSLIYAGGANGSVLNAVWVAGWNPNTGVVGSWSDQTALPSAVCAGASASWNDTVFIIGGVDSGGNVVNSVYCATVNNGQIVGWTSGPPLPQAVALPIAGVVGNWLVVAGGSTTASLTSPTVSQSTYYSAIQSDGSLGPWQTGPNMGIGVSGYSNGWDTCITDTAIMAVCGFESPSAESIAVQVLPVSTYGVGSRWYSFQWREGGVEMVGAFPLGNGDWLLVNPNIPGSQQFYTTLSPLPQISVPLPASGLTPGAKYHVVLQQVQNQSASDFLMYGIANETPISGIDPIALQSPRHTNTWIQIVATGNWNLPVTVYDNTPGGPIFHAWQDPSATGSTNTSNVAARTTTMVYNQRNLLIGVCEATVLPNDPMNSNPTFTTGTSPWTVHNGTLTQSSAQTHGGYAFSGLLTPASGLATASMTSELVPIRAVFPQFSNAQWYQVNGWLYSPTGWGSVSLSIDWYDATSTYLSTSSNTVSLTAATWTNLVNTFQPPTTAAYASINITESSTPSASNTLYLSNVTLALSPELASTVSSVAEITYSGVWPPTGVTQLA